MERRRCVIVGCARNIATQLPKTLDKIEAIRAYWSSKYASETAVVLAENGSIDGTKAVLATYQAIHPFTHVLTLDASANAIKQRTERLAFVRNALLDYVHGHTEYHTYEYLLAVDMDGTLDNFDPASLDNAFQPSIPNWDALFANNDGPYYDIWALRNSATGPAFDCWDMYRHLILQLGLTPQQAKPACITQFQRRIPRTAAPIPVESAFGGLGLYRLAATVGCRYDGLTRFCSAAAVGIPHNKQIGCRMDTCEHVAFHEAMRTRHGAKLFIHPGIVVRTQMEHI
jgi:glycosyltransferase involved in cell wall biosynthesis